MENLLNKFSETTSLAIYRMNKAVIIKSLEGEYYSLNSKIRHSADLHYNANGKIFLSNLSKGEIKKYFDNNVEKLTINTVTKYEDFIKQRDKILDTGISYEIEEFEYGLSCIAAPIKFKNNLIASLSISGPTTRLKYKTFEKLEIELKNIVIEIENSMEKKYSSLYS